MPTSRPHKCGWCITGHCHSCKGRTEFEGNVWICQCPHDVEVVPA